MPRSSWIPHCSATRRTNVSDWWVLSLIGNEDPASLWIRLDGLGDVRGKVGFGARGAKAGRHDLPASHVEIGDQTLSPMPLVFEFLAFDMTGLHGQGWVQMLQSLNAGHLIRAHHMRALCRKGGGGAIRLTHGADLLGQRGRVIGGRCEPVALAVRL
jgi:hypothetical protein